jgi:hypothetical protein
MRLGYFNLLNCYKRASDDVVNQGKEWYEKAFYLCSTLSCKYNVPKDKVAQVIAALSPATNWERNKKDAEELIKAYYHRGYAGCLATTVCTYGANKRKAIEILCGRGQLTLDTGLKTYNFYMNILNPMDENFVTIDRHAYSILLGDKAKRGSVKLNIHSYKRAAKIYKSAAKKLNLTPNQLQAITWVQYRNEKGI